jgi:hypothetical protein
MNTSPTLSLHEIPSNELANPSVVQLAEAANFWSRYDVEMPSKQITSIQFHERCEFAGGIMTDLIFKLTVNQLATSIRLQGVDDEALTMLNMLETLVIAGEIPFPDFMGRMQNLFPEVFDRLDPALLAKLSVFNDD